MFNMDGRIILQRPLRSAAGILLRRVAFLYSILERFRGPGPFASPEFVPLSAIRLVEELGRELMTTLVGV